MRTMEYLLSKLGKVNPATRSKAIEIVSAAQAAGHDIRFVWGMGPGNEHGSGNALDIMVKTPQAGLFVRNYVWTHRKRLRLRHVIWAQHITSTVVKPGVKRKMADRGSVTENHFDHNHIWFLDDKAYVKPGGSTPSSTSGSRKTNVQVAREVWAGKWGTGDDRKRRLRAAGYNPDTIQALVNKGVGVAGASSDPKRKSVATIAGEVLAGKWGNGDDRKRRLTRAGYNYDQVQREVNKRA